FQVASVGGLGASINLYWQLLQASSLKFVVLLALLSAVLLSAPALRRSTFPFFYVLTNLAVIILFYNTTTGFSLVYTSTRFLLGTAVAFVLLASGAMIGIFDELLVGLRWPEPLVSGGTNSVVVWP